MLRVGFVDLVGFREALVIIKKDNKRSGAAMLNSKNTHGNRNGVGANPAHTRANLGKQEEYCFSRILGL